MRVRVCVRVFFGIRYILVLKGKRLAEECVCVCVCVCVCTTAGMAPSSAHLTCRYLWSPSPSTSPSLAGEEGQVEQVRQGEEEEGQVEQQQQEVSRHGLRRRGSPSPRACLCCCRRRCEPDERGDRPEEGQGCGGRVRGVRGARGGVHVPQGDRCGGRCITSCVCRVPTYVRVRSKPTLQPRACAETFFSCACLDWSLVEYDADIVASGLDRVRARCTSFREACCVVPPL